jgi:hypothetical protein
MRNSGRYFSIDYPARCAPGGCGTQIKWRNSNHLYASMRSRFILNVQIFRLNLPKASFGALQTIGYSGLQRIVSISNPETHARSNVAALVSAHVSY